MLELRKYGGFIAFIALASCSSGGGGGGVTPATSAQIPHNAAGQRMSADTKRRHERPLAGAGAAIQITSFTPPSDINSPKNGLTFAYGGIYYTFASHARPMGGVGSFNGRYWNDYESYNAFMLDPLTLDATGNIDSVIENIDFSELGIDRYDPHTGVESREFFSAAKYGLDDLTSNIALDSKNQLWFEDELPSATAIGFAAKPATPQQSYYAIVESDDASVIGYTLAGNFTRGADGNMWSSGTICDGEAFPCTVTQDIIRWTAARPYTETNFVVPSAPGVVTLGPDSNLWFTMPGASEIGRITPNGAIATFKIPAPSGGGSFHPSAIAAGDDGALWFLSDQHALIGRITTKGVVSEYTGSAGELAITRGIHPTVPVWFSVGGTPGSLNSVTVP